MEKFEVVGWRNVSFKAQDGAQIDGINLYLKGDAISHDGDGNVYHREFVSVSRCVDCKYKPSLGQIVVINYNRYGKIAGISVA